MRVVRALVAVSTVALSMLSAMKPASAQAPAARPATAKPATAKPAAVTAPVATTEEGNPIPASPFPAGPPSKAGLELKAIHKEDTTWREAQRGAQPPRAIGRIQPTALRSVDPATQQKTLDHFQSVQEQVEKLDPTGMSESERMNVEIYRYQIGTLIDGQKFKEFEKPVNSLETFWSGVQGTGQRGFRTEQDYLNYLIWLADIPRFFDENIANMKAGLARGFTPPKVTLAGRDQTIAPIANAKSADVTPFWKPFTKMPSTINTAEQARLRAEGKKVIEAQVIPAYKPLLTFWNNEYYPHTVKSIAATDLPDGKAYYKAQIKRYTTLDMTAEEIHAFGLAEVAKIHQEMLDTMAEAAKAYCQLSRLQAELEGKLEPTANSSGSIFFSS